MNTHKQQVVNDKREKDAENAEKARERKERLDAIGIETDRGAIQAMTDPKLKDQLELHRRRGDKDIPIKARLKNKSDRLAALLATLTRLETSLAVRSSEPP